MALSHQREPLGDHLAIPTASVLVFEQHNIAGGIEARRRPRVLQEDERE